MTQGMYLMSHHERIEHAEIVGNNVAVVAEIVAVVAEIVAVVAEIT